MPSKLMIALISLGAVGAAAIAGTTLALSLGAAKPEVSADEAPASETETAVYEMTEVSPAAMPGAGPVNINPDDFGDEPDFSEQPARTNAGGSRWGLGKEKLPPPRPRAACITEAQMNEALGGSGCDCSCDGYAREVAGTGSDQCEMVCGLPWYICWAPDPTEAEIEQAALEVFANESPEARAVMEPILREELKNPESRANYAGGIVMSRAAAWANERMCTEGGSGGAGAE